MPLSKIPKFYFFSAPYFRAPVQSKLAADRVTVGSFLKTLNPVESHQVTPASKTLQERLVELQVRTKINMPFSFMQLLLSKTTLRFKM